MTHRSSTSLASTASDTRCTCLTTWQAEGTRRTAASGGCAVSRSGAERGSKPEGLASKGVGLRVWRPKGVGLRDVMVQGGELQGLYDLRVERLKG
eukprot:364937-Chlamydomonas_euryale.AAC.30